MTTNWLDEYEANRKYDPDAGRVQLPTITGDYTIMEGLVASLGDRGWSLNNKSISAEGLRNYLQMSNLKIHEPR